jgi:hypothetical protein
VPGAGRGGADSLNEVTIDLLEAQLVTGIALQDRASSSAQWPTLVEIETSRDGTMWHCEGRFGQQRVS